MNYLFCRLNAAASASAETPAASAQHVNQALNVNVVNAPTVKEQLSPALAPAWSPIANGHFDDDQSPEKTSTARARRNRLYNRRSETALPQRQRSRHREDL